MAVVRIPFCATAELQPPFMLDETYANTNGIKSILFDKSKLQVAAKLELIDVPDVGEVEMCIFYVVGTIPYICNAFPVVQSDPAFDVHEQIAAFNNQTGNTASDCIATMAGDALGWISAVGCVNVDAPIGGDCSIADMPSVLSVTVDDLAVANNPTSTMDPTCESCGEEAKRVVKWRGCFVVTTGEP